MKTPKSQPVRLLIYLTGSIFAVEAVIMFVLPHLGIGESSVLSALIDASSLTIIVFPVLYFFVFQPLLREITRRERTEAALAEAKDGLEIKVKERTAELQKSNDELKRAQTQMIQQEKIASIGQLAAGVSHELNNPLGGILGYAQLILEEQRQRGLDKPTANDLEKIFTYVGYIERESRRCKDIVTDLLKFSRPSGAEMTPLDINQVLEETLALTGHQLKIHFIKLATNLAAGLPKITGNKQHLQQVFTNIIINAQHSMPEGGKLAISTAIHDGRLEIEFTDTGRGIPAESLGRIFDPFFTTKAPGEGTGLGLSVSYGIIKEHKGDISVDSAVGQGTTFTIKLPVGVLEEVKAQ